MKFLEALEKTNNEAKTVLKYFLKAVFTPLVIAIVTITVLNIGIFVGLFLLGATLYPNSVPIAITWILSDLVITLCTTLYMISFSKNLGVM